MRYADIVAFPRDSKTACVVDPTVRYGSNRTTQVADNEEEKMSIHKRCIPILEKYSVRSMELLSLQFTRNT